MRIRVLRVAAALRDRCRSVAAVAGVKLLAARRSAPTLFTVLCYTTAFVLEE